MPYIKFDNPGKKHSNKGSCSRFLHYLAKEDVVDPVNREFYFNHSDDMIREDFVKHKIEHNIKALGKNDAKFYTGSISFSTEELNFLKNDKTKIKRFVNEFFRLYAENFNKGLQPEDINWYGKLENLRYYKGDDPEVLSGRVNQGDRKPGLHTHVHFIIGRKSTDGKHKLSPKTNHRNTKAGPVQGGFDRDSLNAKAELLFDELFSYNRQPTHSYEYFKSAAKSNSKSSKINFDLSSIDDELIYYKKLLPFRRAIKLKELVIELNNTLPPQNKLQYFTIVDLARKNKFNGTVYSNLLNLRYKMNKGQLHSDPTQMVINNVQFNNKPFAQYPEEEQFRKINRLIDQINKDLPADFRLHINDFAPYMNSEIQRESSLTYLTHIKEIINKEYVEIDIDKAKAAKKNLSAIASEIRKCYSNDEIPSNHLTFLTDTLAFMNTKDNFNSFMPCLKRFINSPSKDPFISPAIFLAISVFQQSRDFRVKSSYFRKETIEKYVHYLQRKLEKEGFPIINSEQLMNIAMQSDYSGAIFPYLNKINASLKNNDLEQLATLLMMDEKEIHNFINHPRQTTASSHFMPEIKIPEIPNTEYVREPVPVDLHGITPTFRKKSRSDEEEEEEREKAKRKRKSRNI